jgi:hypothetical protein
VPLQKKQSGRAIWKAYARRDCARKRRSKVFRGGNRANVKIYASKWSDSSLEPESSLNSHSERSEESAFQLMSEPALWVAVLSRDITPANLRRR